MNDPVQVLVVDDHPLFRQGVVQALNASGAYQVVGEASSGEEALAMSRELMPDLVLLDVSMPGWSGLETAEKISIACPASMIVLLTASEDHDTLLAAFKAGVRAYVLKGISAQKLHAVLQSALSGEIYVSPPLATEMLASLTRGPAPDPLQELTDREKEILGLIGLGLTNREIGQRICLSEKTIKHYVTNILQKLQVRSRVEAALLSQRERHAAVR